MLSDRFDQRTFLINYTHVQNFALSDMVFDEFNSIDMMKLIKSTSELYSITIPSDILCHLQSIGFKLNTHKIH